MSQPARVVADYVPVYADPIRVQAGDPVAVGGEDLEFPGWRWCTSRDGRAGWVPVELIDFAGAVPTIMRAYSAVELRVIVNEPIVVEESCHGWLLVTNVKGEQGWIPASHVIVEVDLRGC
jgi:hypothetical protein